MTLRTYILKRLLWSVLLLWAVATLVFLIVGADPTAQYGMPGLKPDVAEKVVEIYGWRAPIDVRYVYYLRNMFTYGLVFPWFGWSTWDKDWVGVGLVRRLPFTLSVVGTATAITVTLGVLIGMFAGSKEGTKKDKMIGGFFMMMWAAPLMVIEFMAIVLFSYIHITYKMWIFPVEGLTMGTPSFLGRPSYTTYLDIAWHLCLPVACLVIAGLGRWILYTRNMMVDTLQQDYVYYTARAKGLKQRTILFKHALRSILPQVATMVATVAPTIIAGSMITEAIFGIPGIGNWYIKIAFTPEGQVVRWTDPAATQAVFFVYANLVVWVNFLADLLAAVFDPRIRLGARK
jgi:peptide/nickel transport system permease protein